MSLIGRSFDPASISALAAIFGSLAGALASSVSTWITQRHQDRRDISAKRLFHREQLYSDFISQSARAMADAIQHDFQDANMLGPTYALLSRIRLSPSSNVLESAERVIQHIISNYSKPNLTPEQIQSGASNRETCCVNSAVSAVLNSKECKSYCDSDLNNGGISVRGQKHASYASS